MSTLSHFCHFTIHRLTSFLYINDREPLVLENYHKCLYIFVGYSVPKTKAGIKQCHTYCVKNSKCTAFTFAFAHRFKTNCYIKRSVCKKIKRTKDRYTYIKKKSKKSKLSTSFSNFLSFETQNSFTYTGWNDIPNVMPSMLPYPT